MPEYYENIYPYKPSLPLALSAATLFVILALLHTYQALRSKSWYLAAFVTGGYLECLGYLARAISIQQRPKYTLAPFAASLTLILVAPALFAASIYMLFGRIVRLLKAEHHAIIRIGWLTKIFVFGDVVSFAAQAIGAVILSQQTADSYDRGNLIVIIGLAIQIIFFGLFLATALWFHLRTNRHLSDRSRHPQIPWRRHMLVIHAASAIILVRCLYRFVEYRTESATKHGYLLAHEWPMYVFDALLMLATMMLFFVQHPSGLTALRHSVGGVAMKYLSGRRVDPVNDSWRTVPPPTLDPKMMAGDRVVKMARYPPRDVQLAQANAFRAWAHKPSVQDTYRISL